MSTNFDLVYHTCKIYTFQRRERAVTVVITPRHLLYSHNRARSYKTYKMPSLVMFNRLNDIFTDERLRRNVK
jgi:hypothetical protein